MKIKITVKPVDETLKDWKWSVDHCVDEACHLSVSSGYSSTKEEAENAGEAAAREYAVKRKKEKEATKIIDRETVVKEVDIAVV